MLTAIIITAALGLGAGGVAGHKLARNAAERDAAEVQDVHDGIVTSLRAELADEREDLATCRAEVAPKSLDAAGRVIEASQAADIADLELRAAVVSAIPATTYAEAVIASGSPRSIAAAEALAGCRAANTQGDSARSGCATVIPQAWAAAVAELDACPAEAE